MELKKFAPIFAILLAIGVIFGSFEEFSRPPLYDTEGNNLNPRFGFDWFTDMLWFVVGFTGLIIVGLLIWAGAEVGEAKILAG